MLSPGEIFAMNRNRWASFFICFQKFWSKEEGPGVTGAIYVIVVVWSRQQLPVNKNKNITPGKMLPHSHAVQQYFKKTEYWTAEKKKSKINFVLRIYFAMKDSLKDYLKSAVKFIIMYDYILF